MCVKNNNYFFSPLEQFEINSFNTFLKYSMESSIENVWLLDVSYFESNYFGIFLNMTLYSFLKLFLIGSLVFIFQTFFKQKGYVFLFIFLQILLVAFNWASFTDYVINYAFGDTVEGDYYEALTYFGFPVFFLVESTYIYVTAITHYTNIYSVIFCFIFIYFIIYLIYNKMLSNNTNTLIPSLYQILAENLYKLSLNLFYSILGKHVTIPEFFIKINTIFIFLIISNVQGMIPYMSTLTSALTNTFFIALALFLSILTTLLDKKGINYLLNLFMPSGCPILLSLLIIPIELISYSFRLVSLSVRLFANMMAGHTLLKVIVGFSWIIIFLGNTWLINLFPILILFILTLLEFGVAIIQAYIFTVLSCIYLRDIFEGH